MTPNIRRDILTLMEKEHIPIAAIAREIKAPTAELWEWLASGRKNAEFTSSLTEFLANRVTFRHIFSEVGSELRGNAASKYLLMVTELAAEMAGAQSPIAREEIHAQMLLHIADLQWLIGIMASEQTVRSQLKPGDRVMIVK